jgi:mxaL protein
MSPSPRRIRLLLLGCALALLAYAAWYREPPTPGMAGVGIVMMFDISQSMLVEDVHIAGRATSRLNLAKRAAARVVDALPCGASVGAGVFAAHRSVLLYSPVEVCANRAELTDSIALVDINMAWSGNSEIAKGYYASLAVAHALPDRPALIFLTDGHEAPPVNPRHRPSFQGQMGAVKAAVVGVGGALPSPIPKRDPQGRALGYWNADEVMQIDPYRLPRTAGSSDLLVESGLASEDDLRAAGTPGSEHLSSLRSDYLQLLAAETGTIYRSLGDPEELVEVARTLLSLSLETLPMPSRRLAMFMALAAAAAFYCVGLLPWPPAWKYSVSRVASKGG